MRLLNRRAGQISTLSILGGALLASTSSAALACTFTITALDDNYVCASGTAPDLIDLLGNNTLLFPAGGSGQITGSVQFGAGRDTIIVRSGSAGAVLQGAEVDHLEMSGGVIASLQQGDGYDTFLMSGGTITGAFTDGDFAQQTGGTIGRVDMKLADNFYYLSGGQILGSLVTGFGLDTIEVSGGVIGGAISTSGGDDIIRISGGSVGGGIRASFGSDTLEWSGGTVFGGIQMAGDSDTATLRNLSAATLTAAGIVDGGIGGAGGAPAASDLLIFDRTSATTGARFTNWETIRLTNGSIFHLPDQLLLGDTTSGTGRLDIDASSFLTAENAASIAPALAGQLTSVNNAGVIQLSNTGAPSPTDTLTIFGNYQGLNGSLLLDTYLGLDGSASDRLIISGGAASGLTGLGIVNAGGPGGGTTGSGILVVSTANGGTTTPGTFALDRAVAAGAHEYLLFRGGVNAGEAENWYLRSQLVAVPTPPPPAPLPPPPAPPAPVIDEGTPPTPPVLPPAPVDPAPDLIVPGAPPAPPDPVDPLPPAPLGPPPPGSPPPPTATVLLVDPLSPFGFQIIAPTSQATPPDASLLLAGGVIPLYRLEAANYAAVQPAAHWLALESLSTFHGRRGEQDFLPRDSERQNFWFRALGEMGTMGWSGTVAPSLDGKMAGFQAGMDLYSVVEDNGDATQAGVFAGYSGLAADVRGFALGWANFDTGTLNLGAASVGAYGTRTGENGWYLDGVLMASFYHGNAKSTRGVGADVSGLGLMASLEVGYPFHFDGGWVLEPQAQLILQHTRLGDTRDPFAAISFDPRTRLTGRVGARLYNRIETEGGFIQPELTANLWQDVGEFTTRLDTDMLTSPGNATYLELGAGISGEINPEFSYFARASHSFDLAGPDRSVSTIRFGLQKKW